MYIIFCSINYRIFTNESFLTLFCLVLRCLFSSPEQDRDVHQSVECDEQSCQVHEFHNTRVGAEAHGKWSPGSTWRFCRGYVEQWDRSAVLCILTLHFLVPFWGHSTALKLVRDMKETWSTDLQIYRTPFKLQNLVCMFHWFHWCICGQIWICLHMTEIWTTQYKFIHQNFKC